ncbi:hypothetical protein KVH07_27570 [Streptomyces olivaceus]|uniref:hypothetical protein n=1 Tax=Streptomyces olivaceus TaxID=47716 RepID=UPI001CCCB0FC|nr:hypothetical protein [Streptomyces olivaceus]MBZ6196650.1 hypothetical protein [Streptomyces olivaceus]MBZ6283553.1 hypothetical protein [Streptomyces olivaceus]MBZ6295514.1 hypothetical protein [Streptomyces olivaceus]MBZ6307428.1 hypothetical protein [Streptomyces olivaceus]MBZ6321323.1 hypothetical protein [Streptomyces olivaceus]
MTHTRSHEPAQVRRAPVDLPAPYGDNNIEREPLWYAFGAGSDEPAVPPWTRVDQPPMTAHTHPPPPSCARGGSCVELPRETHELLDRTPYPHGRAAVRDPDEALLRALVAGFGVQWSDPDAVYDPHRGYASPRCLYPVQVFVDDGQHWHLLDPERHTLTVLTAGTHRGRQRRIALTGRYTRIPSGYKWFRGSLVNLELGIVLRQLALALELFGLSGRVVLPHGGSAALLDELGLTPGWEWSLPTVVEIGPESREPAPAADAPKPEDQPGKQPEDQPEEPALRDLVRVNRTQDFTDAPAPLPSAVPARPVPGPGTASWADLMWRRNSGRMPRGLLGMSGRRTRVPAGSVEDALRWLDTPPPGPTLAAVADLVTLTVVTQDVAGLPDGIHRVRAGECVQLSADRTAAARLEAEYGYGLSTDAGCDIRNASAIWFMSVKPRELFARLGANGWSAAQYWCGWALHGLCLSTTAYGMFTRPVRAFNEIPVQRILRLGPDEMLALAAVVGTPRYPAHGLLDIRV